MNKNAKFIIIALIAILIIVLTSASNESKSNNKNNQNNLQPKELAANFPLNNEQEDVGKKNQEIIKVKQLLQESISDIAIGDVDAKVKIIEYASLSCSHCAIFSNNVFGKIKEEYIDTGKVRFIFRHFPLNSPAFVASAASLCSYKQSNQDVEKYYNLIKALFKTQESWAFSKQFPEQLKQILRLNGLSSSSFEKCLANKDLENAILSQRFDASKYLKVSSTPTFFVNGKSMIGAPNYNKMKNAIENALEN